jgi:hypothetical protein
VIPPNPNAWTFNGDLERPTFSPSIKVTSKNKDQEIVCHSFVTDGQINFLNDCTAHPLRGLHPLPEFKKYWGGTEPFES